MEAIAPDLEATPASTAADGEAKTVGLLMSLVFNDSRLPRNAWNGRYSRLRSFFDYWMAKREISRLPMLSRGARRG